MVISPHQQIQGILSLKYETYETAATQPVPAMTNRGANAGFLATKENTPIVK